ncbi:hypothetical protein AB7G19_29970 [Bradyrhizobium sp. 215_C5_N1_1]
MTDIQKHNFRLLRQRLRGVSRTERLRTYLILRSPLLAPLALAVLDGEVA